MTTRNRVSNVAAAIIGGLTVWIACQAFGDRGVIVLHRAGNPPDMYIVKFDALGKSTNMLSCEEFKGFVEKLSPETGPVRCSPLH